MNETHVVPIFFSEEEFSCRYRFRLSCPILYAGTRVHDSDTVIRHAAKLNIKNLAASIF